jgi:hypothetical protein
MVARLLDCNILVLVIGLFSGVFVNVLVSTNDGLNVPLHVGLELCLGKECNARVDVLSIVDCRLLLQDHLLFFVG